MEFLFVALVGVFAASWVVTLSWVLPAVTGRKLVR
jgi:hypothetical protein